MTPGVKRLARSAPFENTARFSRVTSSIQPHRPPKPAGPVMDEIVANGRTVALVRVRSRKDGRKASDPEGEANMRRLLAAPKMEKAIRAVVERLEAWAESENRTMLSARDENAEVYAMNCRDNYLALAGQLRDSLPKEVRT